MPKSYRSTDMTKPLRSMKRRGFGLGIIDALYLRTVVARLSDADAERDALKYIIDNDLTVAATEAYIDALLTAQPEEKTKAKRTFIVKDVRLFLNTVNRGLELMKQGGIDAGIRREETDDRLILTISIPKNKSAEKQE